jgi:hypothetical protein
MLKVVLQGFFSSFKQNRGVLFLAGVGGIANASEVNRVLVAVDKDTVSEHFDCSVPGADGEGTCH